MRTNMEICSIIITYNRKELLIKNIDAILGQSMKTDILIYDNHSNDGTKNYLKEKGYLNFENIYYFYSEENVGGAGGFSNAMKIAYEKGYELFFLMDDDGKAYDMKTIENLYKKYKELEINNCIMNSLVICNDKKELSFKVFKEKNYEMLEKNNLIENMIIPFNGTLITRKTIEKIGYPKSEFFIRGDEREYLARARANNIKLFVCTNSLYYHPKAKISTKKLLWKKVIWSDEAMWKKYYEIRNSVYIYKNYNSKLKLYKYIICTYAKNLLLDKKNIKKIEKALKDGLNGDFSYKAHLEMK